MAHQAYRLLRFDCEFRDESLTGAKLIALTLSFFGLTFFADQILSGSSGITFCIAAGFFGGLATFMYKYLKILSNNVILAYQYGIGSALAMIVMFISGDEIIRDVSLKVSVITLIFSFILIAGSALLVYGYRYFDVNVGTALTSSEIVFGIILAYFLYKEVPNSQEMIGGMFILAGSMIGSLDFSELKDSRRLT